MGCGCEQRKKSIQKVVKRLKERIKEQGFVPKKRATRKVR